MKAVNKNTFREISKSKSRFLSILLICAIGVGFFSGVRATCGIMKTSADDYFDEHNLFDLRVLSTFGLTEDDVKAISEVEGVDGVYPSKYTDLALHRGEEEYLTRVFSKTSDEINKVDIFEGRAPETDEECIVSYNILHEGIKVGDKITLEDLTEADEFPLVRDEYTVVGLYSTPMYISKTQRGSTNIGDGAIDAFMIVPEEHFTQDVYTEIYVRSDTLKGFSSYSDEYKDFRDSISDKLETLGISRSEIRYDEVIGDALREIEDGERELEKAKVDGQKELDDAKKELDDAAKQIADGEKELADAKKELDDGAAQLADGEKELADAKKEIDDGKAALAETEKTLADAKKQLDDSKEQLDAGQAELNSQKAALEEGKAQLNTARSQYEQGLAQYEEGLKQLQQMEQAYGSAAVAELKAQLEQTKAQLDAAFAQITQNEQTIAAGEEQLSAAQAEIDAGQAQYNAGLAEYEGGYSQYLDGKKALEDAEREYNDGAETLAQKRQEYNDGLKSYEDGKAELEDAKKKYEDGLVEYNDGAAEYNSEIADAEKELSDAREEISDAGNAEWYIFTRDDNVGYSEYESNSERINRIAAIFPVFFLLVAGLVCLTTMSRMVEEQRTQIGTLKALGYSNGAVMRHYMIYAVSGAAIGGAVGAVGGCFLFPSVIVYAYSMMYDIKKIHYLFTPENMIVSIGSMTLAIALTVFFSCRKALEETPASLMRPKAPKAGKRVLIERIPFLWNHMSFFAKVSGRNIFRYKRRMFMTIVGIAGCTALSLTGLGLKNSISDIVDLQYDKIYKYSGYLAYDEDAKPSEIESIYDTLLEYEPNTKYTRALIKQYETDFSGNKVTCYVTCVEDTALFEQFVDLHERRSGEKLSLSDGAIITEKAAKLLGLSAGDTLNVKISDSSTKSLVISGITEQYTSHYLYMSESVYKELFGASPKFNMVYFDNGISRDEAVQDAFSEHVIANDNVLALIMNASSLSSVHETLQIMDLVTVVLIVSAAALAFVVLYNLTNVNITERIREIATLKVLGFYDMEVSSYIFRENIILSIMGGIVGLGLGYALCMFVITTAEIDEVMFGRSIHAPSYLWAFLITLAFSLIVNFIMTGVLKKISMVESLKSVE